MIKSSLKKIFYSIKLPNPFSKLHMTKFNIFFFYLIISENIYYSAKYFGIVALSITIFM